MASKTLSKATLEVCKLIRNHKEVVDNVGTSYIGVGKGINVKTAMEKAIFCPLLGDSDLQQAEMVLVNIHILSENIHADIVEALELLFSKIHKETRIAWGWELQFGKDVEVFLIATCQS